MPESQTDAEFVTVVNPSGVKQDVPREWLNHPVLGKDFKLPPSAESKKS